jgi:urea carboxylase
MWNRYREGGAFEPGKPWLLRFFDQVRFYPVEAHELLDIRAAFPWGRYPLRIEPTTLRLADYRRFLDANADSIEAFRARQRAAFAAERAAWRAAGVAEVPQPDISAPAEQVALPPDCIGVRAPVSGSVWQVKAQAGQRVAAGEELLVMESMKMEISVRAAAAGEVAALYCTAGRPASAGDLLVAVRPVAGEAG